jgi:RNA polymerase sigma-70 factor (ECF subfamily)
VPEEAIAIEPRSEGLAIPSVQAALMRLSPGLREAFLLKHVEELTYEEMAQVTGEGISALKMRVKRACGELRAHLATGSHYVRRA